MGGYQGHDQAGAKDSHFRMPTGKLLLSRPLAEFQVSLKKEYS